MKIYFKLRYGINRRELDAFQERFNLKLEPTSSYCFPPEFLDLSVLGSLASIIALFLYLKDKYDNRVAINIRIDDKTNVKDLDAAIEYLTSLKGKINARLNKWRAKRNRRRKNE